MGLSGSEFAFHVGELVQSQAVLPVTLPCHSLLSMTCAWLDGFVFPRGAELNMHMEMALVMGRRKGFREKKAPPVKKDLIATFELVTLTFSFSFPVRISNIAWATLQ